MPTGARQFTEFSSGKQSAGRPLYAILLREEDQDHLCRCEAVPWVMSAGKKSWWYQYRCQGIPQEFLKLNISTWTNSHVVFLMKEWMWASMNIICLAPLRISMIRPIICIFLKSFGHEIHKVSRTAKTSHAGPLLSMLKHVSLQVCLPDMIWSSGGSYIAPFCRVKHHLNSSIHVYTFRYWYGSSTMLYNSLKRQCLKMEI